MILIHGDYGVGKTHLSGDMLRWVHGSTGSPVRYINTAGEDGYSTLAGLGLGRIGVTCDSVTDLNDAFDELIKSKGQGLVVDSLTGSYKLMLKKVIGEVRYPDPTKDGQKAQKYWGEINLGMYNLVTRSRNAAPFVLWLAPHDLSMDRFDKAKESKVTPNLPGALASECRAWFDYVGYMKADIRSKADIKRTISFAPDATIATRQRVPAGKQVLEDIVIPSDTGGWEAIWNKLKKALERSI